MIVLFVQCYLYIWNIHNFCTCTLKQHLCSNTGENWRGRMDKDHLQSKHTFLAYLDSSGNSHNASHEMLFINYVSHVGPKSLNHSMLQNQNGFSFYSDDSYTFQIFSHIFVSEMFYLSWWLIKKKKKIKCKLFTLHSKTLIVLSGEFS